MSRKTVQRLLLIFEILLFLVSMVICFIGLLAIRDMWLLR